MSRKWLKYFMCLTRTNTCTNTYVRALLLAIAAPISPA